MEMKSIKQIEQELASYESDKEEKERIKKEIRDHRLAGDLVDFVLKIIEEKFCPIQTMTYNYLKILKDSLCCPYQRCDDSDKFKYGKKLAFQFTYGNAFFGPFLKDEEKEDVLNAIKGQLRLKVRKELAAYKNDFEEKARLKQEIDEHRRAGDIIDFLFEIVETKYCSPVRNYVFFDLDCIRRCISECEVNLDSKDFTYGIAYLRPLLKKSEKNELLLFIGTVICIQSKLIFGWYDNFTSDMGFPVQYYGYFYAGCDYDFDSSMEYLYKLSKKKKGSFDYNRCQKICKMIPEYRYKIMEKLEEELYEVGEKKRNKIIYESVTTTVITAILAFTIFFVGTCSVNLAKTKDARMAKKEAQRIEKEARKAEEARVKEGEKAQKEAKKAEEARVKEEEKAQKEAKKAEEAQIKKQKENEAKKAADEKKARDEDKKQLEKIGSAKLSQVDLLVQIKEPKMYVIAPMTYDTQKFAQDNSREKDLFGEKDYSVERLAVLEGCVTDFINKVDNLTGVSFLDRNKIEQIEKEQKFQLSDWSNDKKTAEMGMALNASIMLFLDKFAYIDSDYRFEAKFVDINTMQSSSYNIVYKNPKKEIVTPDAVKKISFRDFTAISTKNTSFEDELLLKTRGATRTSQRKDLTLVSPLGSVPKLDLSEYDTIAPKSDFMSLSSLSVDGFGGIELVTAQGAQSLSYTFEPCELYIERVGNNFFTDGKIGVLVIKADSGYEKFDVYTINNREYYLRLGAAELPKVTVNYYLQMVKN